MKATLVLNVRVAPGKAKEFHPSAFYGRDPFLGMAIQKHPSAKTSVILGGEMITGVSRQKAASAFALEPLKLLPIWELLNVENLYERRESFEEDRDVSQQSNDHNPNVYLRVGWQKNSQKPMLNKSVIERINPPLADHYLAPFQGWLRAILPANIFGRFDRYSGDNPLFLRSRDTSTDQLVVAATRACEDEAGMTFGRDTIWRLKPDPDLKAEIEQHFHRGLPDSIQVAKILFAVQKMILETV